MHLRFSSCIGLPIIEDGGDTVLGLVSGILIHPDTGKVEGFFVHSILHSSEPLFVSFIDIIRWGTRAYVRSADVLSPPHDRIRLQPLLEDSRTVLGQRIFTESGVSLGRCKDVQFNTESMHIEWIFPRKLFRWGVALSVAEIIEVQQKGIIVKNRLQKDPIQKKVSTQPILSDLSESSLVRRKKDI